MELKKFGKQHHIFGETENIYSSAYSLIGDVRAQ